MNKDGVTAMPSTPKPSVPERRDATAVISEDSPPKALDVSMASTSNLS